MLYLVVTPKRVLLFSKEETMKNDQKFLIGVLAFVLGFTGIMGKANALSTENNLSKTTLIVQPTAEAVFLVSKPKSLVAVNKNLTVLEKYQDATHLTDRQLKELLHAVGFRGDGLKKAWAVAKKESNGRPLAFNGNSNTGDNSFGIFQINMIGLLKDARKDKFGINFTSELLNPVINSQVAYHMSNGGKDWSAWHGITPRTKSWMKKFPA
jgi:hypothetical protein